jgi:hypothetical protein
MSVKCVYSDKYRPLVEAWKSNLATYEANVQAYFSNADDVLNNGSVVYNNTPIRSMEVKSNSFTSGLEVSQDVQSVDQFYIEAPSKYRQMSNQFMRRMVESAIYDPKGNNGLGRLINANELNGSVTYLNQAILDYKKELLSVIANHLNENIALDGAAADLDAIQNYLLSKYTPSTANLNVYNAYVILTNFDRLLNLHAPFIQIAPEYTKTSHYNPKRYTYVGAEVKHYTGVMSTDEFMSAENNTSEIVKILLQYFQEIDTHGHPIEGTSINLGGFNSAMTKVYAWAQTNEEAKEELAKDSKADFGKIIDLYLNAVGNNEIKNAHLTYLTNKLRGIKHFIYDGRIPEELSVVFTHLVEKTVPSSYVQYDIMGNDAAIKYLTERHILLQKTFLEECIDTAAEYWGNKANSGLFTKLLDKYKINVSQAEHTYVLNIGNQSITISGGYYGQVGVSGDIDNIVNIIEDIAQLFVSEDTENVAKQLNDSATLTQLYAPVIASIVIKSKLNSGFKAPYGPMRDLARTLSIMHGSDVINVVKNGEGNSLPLYQMLCLAYRHNDIHKRLREDHENRNTFTPYDFNIAYNNINNIHAPQIRAGILSPDGTYKSSASLSTDEVMHIAVLHDFYDNLTKKYTLDESSSQRSGIVGFQSHVYSDKNKHFIQMFDLSAEWMIGYDEKGNKKTIRPAEILIAYINGERNDLNPLIEAFWYSGYNQIETLIDTLIEDYRTVFGDSIQSLEDIDRTIGNYKDNIDELRQKFIDAGIDFIEEIHVSKSDHVGVNEAIIYLRKQFATIESTREFLNSQFEQFKTDASTAVRTISKSLDSRENAPEVDRILFAYFVSDVLFTNDYNRMMVGQVFAHPFKNKRKLSDIKLELG